MNEIKVHSGGDGSHPNSRAALEAHRKATQIGAPNGNPKAWEVGTKPWSYRNALRRFARVEVDRDNPKTFLTGLPEKMSAAEYAAAQCIIRSMKSDRAFEICIEQIDGKLAQTNINADISILMSMSDEELLQLASQPLTLAANEFVEVHPPASAGSATDADGQTARIHAPGDAAGV